jgi:riboflavin synthase
LFTGIIEETGAVKSVHRHHAGAGIEIAAAAVLTDLEIGASIAVNGCCLTAIQITPEGFAADLSPETMARTNLGDLAPGRRVNLERPLLPTSRLSGHFVQGHVDATGEFLEVAPAGDDNWTLRVRAPKETLKYLVYKGSVTIDGISLTIARLDLDVIEVAVIPHTYRETNLSDRRPGERVNLECDVLAKHIERLLSSVELPGR